MQIITLKKMTKKIDLSKKGEKGEIEKTFKVKKLIP